MSYHDMGSQPYAREIGRIVQVHPDLSAELWQDTETGETVSGIWVAMGPGRLDGATCAGLPLGTLQRVEYRSHQGVTDPPRTYRRVASEPQDSVHRFADCSLYVQQLDFGIRNHGSEISARTRAYRERTSEGFPGDLCYPLDFKALEQFVEENGMRGIFQHPPHEVRAFR